MALTSEQIERYSRQIIVSGVGGIGQERLLDSHIAIVGDPADVESVLAYIAGAGIGRISLLSTNGRSAADRLAAATRDLNRDVSIEGATGIADNVTLVLALVGSAAALESIRSLHAVRPWASVVFARLDSPAKVAVLPKLPPCLECADADLLNPFSRRADNPGFIAMFAATETFRMLAQPQRDERPMLIEFDGYVSTSREIRGRVSGARCACAQFQGKNAP